jgi:hypothetical protein
MVSVFNSIFLLIEEKKKREKTKIDLYSELVRFVGIHSCKRIVLMKCIPYQNMNQ